MIKYITIFFYLLFLNVSAEEYFKFSSADKKFPNHSEVIVEISFPKKITGKLPLIITQHGSTRDGKKIQDGATDEYSKRIIKEGTKQGFAVAALDAFYKKPITSTEKSNNIVEIQAFPESNDILSLKDLYLTFAVGNSAINMVKDTITSGEQISGVGYKVTSSYSNGALTRG